MKICQKIRLLYLIAFLIVSSGVWGQSNKQQPIQIKERKRGAIIDEDRTIPDTLVKIRLTAEDLKDLTPFTGEFMALDFYHSLRIPNNHISIRLENLNGKDVKVIIKSQPMQGYTRDNQTIKDTTYCIKFSDYDPIVVKFNKIISADITDRKLYTGFGTDGTTFNLEYGNSNSSVTYNVWCPYSNMYERKLKPFVACVEAIIKISGLQNSLFND